MNIPLLVKLTLGLAASALGAWLLAVMLALPSNSASAVIVLRTLLALLVVLILTRALVRRAYEDSRLLPTIAVGAVLSYVLLPASWGGHALIAQLVLDQWVAAYAVDLVLWIAAVLLAARSVEARTDHLVQPYQAS